MNLRASKHSIGIVIPTLFVILLSGCAVGPNYSTPKAALNNNWIGEAEWGVKRDAQADIEWWKVFRDPALDNLVETAYRDNLDLQIAAMRVLGAMAARGVAIGNLFPQSQTANGSFSRSRLTTGDYVNQWNASFDASWELDLWGKIRRSIESASAQVDASIAGYDDVMVSLIAEVAATYMSIRVSDEQIAIAKSNIVTQTRALKIAQEKYDAGKSSLLDVKQSSSLLDQTRAGLAATVAGRRQSVFRLSTLLGRPPSDLEEFLKGPGTIPSAPVNIAVGTPADLLRRRPDIRVAERQAAAQSALIGVQKAALFPSFYLAGNIGLEADHFDKLWRGEDWTGLINPGFSWPILNYGRIKNNIRAQDAAFQAAALNYQNTVLAAAQEVESSLAGFRGSQEQAGQLALSEAAARDAVVLSFQQYTDGAADFTRVLSSQQTLLEVQSRHAAVRGNIAANLIATYKALGGGWQVRKGLGEMVSPAVRKEMADRTDWSSYFRRLDETGGRTNGGTFYRILDPSGDGRNQPSPALEKQP